MRSRLYSSSISLFLVIETNSRKLCIMVAQLGIVGKMAVLSRQQVVRSPVNFLMFTTPYPMPVALEKVWRTRLIDVKYKVLEAADFGEKSRQNLDAVNLYMNGKWGKRAWKSTLVNKNRDIAIELFELSSLIGYYFEVYLSPVFALDAAKAYLARRLIDFILTVEKKPRAELLELANVKSTVLDKLSILEKEMDETELWAMFFFLSCNPYQNMLQIDEISRALHALRHGEPAQYIEYICDNTKDFRVQKVALCRLYKRLGLPDKVQRLLTQSTTNMLHANKFDRRLPRETLEKLSAVYAKHRKFIETSFLIPEFDGGDYS